MYTLSKAERFAREVQSKFHVYNSVFLTLPFHEIDNTGTLLPLFADACQKGFAAGQSPVGIFEQFADKYLEDKDEASKISLMFRFVQYIERQVVLFDAIEDAAFPIVNNLEGKGSLREVKDNIDSGGTKEKLQDFLERFNVRAVLTAHPTQFYPGSVLGIITDLTEAVRRDNLNDIKQLLSQLGKTPFIKKEKPTPFDEAVSLGWYLENVFYDTAGDIADHIRNNIVGHETGHPVISMGFWPGGDRDGNPFVKADTTLAVAERLRNIVLKKYYADLRKLRRKLTFTKVDEIVADLENRLYRSAYYADGGVFIGVDELLLRLQEIRQLLINEHQSLYLENVDALIGKIHLFGFHFATLDVRQNSKVHLEVISEIVLKNSGLDYSSIADKLEFLSRRFDPIDTDGFSGNVQETVASIRAMKTIQGQNGPRGSHRYVISNAESAAHVLEVLALCEMSGWPDPEIDVVPLLEIIEDLRNAAQIMRDLYTNRKYAHHLSSRGNKQTVMLGFSDGTKDGGYLMANWSIYKAKEDITAVSREFGIDVVFFDGRGGPPARGGGKTHQFYASLGPDIANQEIQLTVQGQTISSNFGTPDSCRHNLENLISAGIHNHLWTKEKELLSADDKKLMDELAQIGHDAYLDFRGDPQFVPYLEQRSALKYYAATNIGSRPAKRNAGEKLNLADLRAIPFVGSWSQLKQNVPGFFGVGAALLHFEQTGRWAQLQELYSRSLFFRTLLENSMMSLAKSFLPLTAYMKDDPQFGRFWQRIADEFNDAKRLLLKIANHKELMENYPDGKASIAMREQIVLPLLTIQQYALMKIDALSGQGLHESPAFATYEKLVVRSLFGNINASRNSA
ncbi:Phosphoenolpyruvate carboxylase [Flavobacterium longum]|uniref:phosphoenolpyruvate carboxylase n=1 Tax=Flavobacterium longum TaxID=1299340 RepID=UPI0039E825F7